MRQTKIGLERASISWPSETPRSARRNNGFALSRLHIYGNDPAAEGREFCGDPTTVPSWFLLDTRSPVPLSGPTYKPESLALSLTVKLPFSRVSFHLYSLDLCITSS